ncbi:hypothetical protein [Capnocytophaga catalasegens]|nr:hypothetical protein [Capnocytophaga catalasegens]
MKWRIYNRNDGVNVFWFPNDNTQKHFASLIEKEYFENPLLTDEQCY